MKFIKSLKSEFKMIKFPKREVFKKTYEVVLSFTLISLFLIFALDNIFQKVIKIIFNI
ncbi:preprotein translocase subunit SecE [Clostridium perfringens]|uniref:Putative preprotein translocase subunit SecE n=1 Tax=Clostridium perfringens TaxID=1502 RepID=A0A140GRS5_CLOPF|nr:preprotein translocase subunit SecE [Clostridium perfringens]AMN31234.1 putative preprotein translocase subunit SecE [Clostridium perfringens]TBX14266.1 preprotein translocase subunit SecE [Clostridium perfringens]